MDRNATSLLVYLALIRSLSARRAWIEITSDVSERESLAVALRKESVDRNVNLRVLDGSKSSSLSARRAWIEMVIRKQCRRIFNSRSPQGERG